MVAEEFLGDFFDEVLGKVRWTFMRRWRVRDSVRGFFGDDDPGCEVDEQRDSAEEGGEDGEDADYGEIPSVVDGEGCADASDGTWVARAEERLRGGWRRRRVGAAG